MATYIVAPSGNGWVVKKGNRAVQSNHRKKSAAKRAAKRMASSGDRVEIRRANGTVQDSRRRR